MPPTCSVRARAVEPFARSVGVYPAGGVAPAGPRASTARIVDATATTTVPPKTDRRLIARIIAVSPFRTFAEATPHVCRSDRITLGRAWTVRDDPRGSRISGDRDDCRISPHGDPLSSRAASSATLTLPC